jgi:hypothetical protein
VGETRNLINHNLFVGFTLPPTNSIGFASVARWIQAFSRDWRGAGDYVETEIWGIPEIECKVGLPRVVRVEKPLNSSWLA